MRPATWTPAKKAVTLSSSGPDSPSPRTVQPSKEPRELQNLTEAGTTPLLKATESQAQSKLPVSPSKPLSSLDDDCDARSNTPRQPKFDSTNLQSDSENEITFSKFEFSSKERREKQWWAENDDRKSISLCLQVKLAEFVSEQVDEYFVSVGLAGVSRESRRYEEKYFHVLNTAVKEQIAARKAQSSKAMLRVSTPELIQTPRVQDETDAVDAAVSGLYASKQQNETQEKFEQCRAATDQMQ